MNEYITSIQPPGLMKMRLMHHQEHHLGHQAPSCFTCQPALVLKIDTAVTMKTFNCPYLPDNIPMLARQLLRSLTLYPQRAC